MDWEQLFQRWEAALPNLTEETSPLFNALSKEAQTALERRRVPDGEWVLDALKGDTAEDTRKRHFIRITLRTSHQMSKSLTDAMLYAAVHEPDPSFNKLFILPCMRTVGPRSVNEQLLHYLEQGINVEKAGAASAFYWSFGLRGEEGVPQEPVADLVDRMRHRFLREYVVNPDVKVRQRILPMLRLDPALYPEAMHPLIHEAVTLSREHDDEYIRHRIEIQLGGKGPYKALPK